MPEFINNATPGRWKLFPGEAGYPATRDDPGAPSIEPFIYVDSPADRDFRLGGDDEFTLCEIYDTLYITENAAPPEIDPNTNLVYYPDTGERQYGDVGVNARLFQMAKVMAEMLLHHYVTAALGYKLTVDQQNKVLDLLDYIDTRKHSEIFNPED